MKKKIFYDIFFYLGFPLLVWNFGRTFLGNYYAILVGTLPALVYAVVDFIRTKEFSVTGLFFLCLLSLNFLLNLFSKNATQELWNEVYVSAISLVFYIVTVIIRKPIGMYFFIDYAHAKGIPRKNSLARYKRKENFYYFQLFTGFLMLREIFVIVCKSFLIKKYGIEGFNTVQIIMTGGKLVFTALMIFYILKILKSIFANQKNAPVNSVSP